VWGKRMEGIYFTDGESFLSEKGDRKKLNIVYYPRINSYNGEKQVQLSRQMFQRRRQKCSPSLIFCERFPVFFE